MQTTPTRKLPYLTPTDKARDIPAQSKAIALELERLVDSGALDGADGARGLQGLPGVNAVPADQAVAQYMAQYGTAANAQMWAAAGAAREARATLSHHVNTAQGYTYEVLRVHTGGATIPGLVGKLYPNDYEKQGTSGNGFRPILGGAETLGSVYARTGADIIINADGHNADSASPNFGLTDAVQIKDGVIYHDFMDPGNYFRGHDALGFRWDGTVEFYSSKRGDTAQSMVSDGVQHSFCFGPAFVIDGVKQTIEGSAVSSRQILCLMPDGDLLVVSTSGISGVNGPTYQQAADLAYSLGVKHAIPLDGGGSTQTMVNGQHSHASSDAAGPRGLGGSFLLIRARFAGDVATSWETITPKNGFTNHSYPMQVRLKNRLAQVRGAVIHATATGAQTAATLPWYAKPDFYQRFPGMVNANDNRYYDVNTDGDVILVSSLAQSAPRYLSNIQFPTA